MAKPDKSSRLYRLRHSCSHALAQAVIQMFPEAKLGIGPPIENGFYYDFELPRTLIPEDLPLLEEKMKNIIKERQKFVRRDEPIDKAIEFLKKAKQPFKVDLCKEWKKQGAKEVSFYENVDGKGSVKFVDLCEGNHVEHLGEIKAFVLLHAAGAYWRGNEKNPMLQRIYGACFDTKEELQAYLKQQEEAKKRDHRKLGKELGLFLVSPLVGNGLPMLLPKGERVKHELLKFIREEKEKRGYRFVSIPHIAKAELYEKSGHLGKYDAMMPLMEDENGDRFAVKAMNCPHHFEIYKSFKHSYRDLPLRIAENTTCYRNEKSGELSGLVRIKNLTQDDTHHFIRHDQIQSEIEMVLDLMKKVYGRFGFKNYNVQISLRDPDHPEKYFGDDKLWSKAEDILVKTMEKWGAPHTIEHGEAAFYGPKIDIMVADAIGRTWQLTTIQLDFVQPENFEMRYTGEDGKEHAPAVLHVAIYGSLERFMGILIEHYAGAFPLWLAPVQTAVLPVSEKFLDYAQKVSDTLRENGFRAVIDDSNEKLGKKIRNAELQKIPFMLVVGEREEKDGTVNVRDYSTKTQETKDIKDFIKSLS